MREVECGTALRARVRRPGWSSRLSLCVCVCAVNVYCVRLCVLNGFIDLSPYAYISCTHGSVVIVLLLVARLRRSRVVWPAGRRVYIRQCLCSILP